MTTPMISDPFALFVYLLSIAAAVTWLSEAPRLRRFFDVVPAIAFLYFLPMLSTTFGITPAESPLYKFMSANVLPAVLLLLLLSANIPAIVRLGPVALGVMLAGSLGVMVGGVLSYAALSSHLGPEGWKNIGALTASWTGGSANMFAVQSALGISQKEFVPVAVIDPIGAYLWMGLVLAFASRQHIYDEKLRAKTALLASLVTHTDTRRDTETRPTSTRDLLMILGVGFACGFLCKLFGAWMHGAIIKPNEAAIPLLSTFSATALTIIGVTVVGIVLSFSPVSRLENVGASRVAYAIFYVLLPTYGAQGNLRALGQAPWYAVAAAIILLSMAAFTFLAMRVTKAPLFFGAAGSQANVGGPATASIVAAAYRPPLASVGVLLGLLGGIIGTFVGLGTAQICRWVSGQ